MYLQAAYLPVNISKKEWMLQLVTHEPWGPTVIPCAGTTTISRAHTTRWRGTSTGRRRSTSRAIRRTRRCGRSSPGAGADNELWRFWEVTATPRVGARILLTNFEHIVQLGATPEHKVYMHANRDSWETWTVEDASGGLFFLRSAHGTYLGSKESGEVSVTPNRDAWERWSITFNDGFRVRSAQWGRNLGSRPDGSVYTHTNCLAWERWWAPVVG